MVNIDGLTTETVNEATKNIDELDSLGIVTLINNEDKKVALAVEKELPNIARAVDEIAARFKRGGRIIYCGAGSSGRMGTLDAVELTPTYSVSPDRAFGLLAGGETAMYKAVEGAEDSKELALEDLKGVQITKDDCIIGIAASGRTPYTISALEYANEVGALSISITCNGESEMAKIADISIAPVVGAEAVSGSTRMKAGTAQKMVLNMLSTGSMVMMGKVYGNLMVDVQATNQKLKVRCENIVMEATGLDREAARAALEAADGQVKLAICMTLTGMDREAAQAALEQAGGRLRTVLERK